MKTVVTGATGFIGQAFIAGLLAQGHEVIAWVRDEARARRKLGAQVHYASDATGELALQRSVDGADAVVNLAGEPVVGRWSAERKRALVDSRVGLTARLVQACEDAAPRPSVLVSASAIGYYGHRGDERLNETNGPGEGFLADLCLQWERAALRAESLGMRVVVPRIGVVLGVDGGALARMLPPFRAGAGGPLGSGRQYMPWIHLDDLTAVLLRALSDERMAGPINAVGPQPATNREFARALGAVLKRPTVLRTPGFALKLAFGEGASVLLGGQRVEPAALQRLGFAFRFNDIKAALRDLIGDARL